MNLRDFWEANIQFNFLRILEDGELSLVRDSSGYVVVDGEEGDCGVVRYLDATGKVVAIKTVEPGDEVSWEVTSFGKPLIADRLQALFLKALSDAGLRDDPPVKNNQIPMSMAELASDAEDYVSDLLSDRDWDKFEALSDAEKVQWRYCHSDCDDFALALHEITGFPVVAINDVRNGPMHRLVEAPDGRMLDARGWVTLDDLKARYKLKGLKVYRDGDGINLLHTGLVDDDEDLFPILSAIFQLPVAPFNESEFQKMALAFSQKVGFSVTLPVAIEV